MVDGASQLIILVEMEMAWEPVSARDGPRHPHVGHRTATLCGHLAGAAAAQTARRSVADAEATDLAYETIAVALLMHLFAVSSCPVRAML